MTLPIVKHSYLVLTAEDLPGVVKDAFHIAQSGRPGPVVIDIPKDVQQKVFEPFSLVRFLNYQATPSKLQKQRMRNCLKCSILLSKQKSQFFIPVVESSLPRLTKNLKNSLNLLDCLLCIPSWDLGSFDPDHEQSLYWYGMHGTVAGNWAVCESDLLICAGARFDDRITGKVDKYAPDAYVIHFDLDKSEHNKNVHAHFPIRSDIRYALKRMSELFVSTKIQKPELTSWLSKLNEWKAKYPFKHEKGEHITSQEAVEVLYEESQGEAIITTGVGQHQMWAAQYYRFKEPRTYISSLGLGTMGFGYPAAIGAKVARPDKEVIDIDGDGSFLMNVQELATAKIEKINAKCLLLNNQHLGMVVQWEDRFYDSVRGHTILCDPENIGGPENLDAIYPDYIKMCEGFGVKARRVTKREDLRDAMREMLAADEPYLLEIIVPTASMFYQ